jgi:hypothetical protein
MTKYKLFFIISFLILFAKQKVLAQVPQGIPYQAIARNGQGQPLAITNVKVRFSILDSTATGTAVYVETHNTTTSALGLFTANVGMGSPSAGTFSAINWGQNFKFLKVELDTTATGNSYIDLGTQQMMSVPYALYAGKTISQISTNTSVMHGHYTFNNVGSISYWIVPDGLNLINVLFSGSAGGSGGTAFNGQAGYNIAGGSGGTCGYVNMLLTVKPGDTISYFLGANGLNGYNIYCANGCCNTGAGFGTFGDISWIKQNSIQIAKIIGGGAGTPSIWNNNCIRSLEQAGSNGYLDVNNLIDSGIFLLSTTNDFNIGCNQMVIRY